MESNPQTTTEALTRAIEALSTAGKEYDSRHDELVALAVGWFQDGHGGWHAVGRFFNDGVLRMTNYCVELPQFTRSIDAALYLLPSGFSFRVGNTPSGAFSIIGTRDKEYYAATPAKALCLGILEGCYAKS